MSSANCRAKSHFQVRTSVPNPIFRCPPLRCRHNFALGNVTLSGVPILGEAPETRAFKLDDRQITHLICARLKYDLYDFFRGYFNSRARKVSRDRSRIIRPSLIAPEHSQQKNVLGAVVALKRGVTELWSLLEPSTSGSFAIPWNQSTTHSRFTTRSEFTTRSDSLT